MGFNMPITLRSLMLACQSRSHMILTQSLLGRGDRLRRKPKGREQT